MGLQGVSLWGRVGQNISLCTQSYGVVGIALLMSMAKAIQPWADSYIGSPRLLYSFRRIPI